jgi:hypothetical protein
MMTNGILECKCVVKKNFFLYFVFALFCGSFYYCFHDGYIFSI